MSVVFEQIDAEIANEPTAKPVPASADAAKPGETIDMIRRELALVEQRSRRLLAD